MISELDETGKAFLQHEEGCRLTAYRDSVGVLTIGYGNTFYTDGSPVKEGDTITQEQADELFDAIIAPFEATVSNETREDLTQNEFNALVSLCYNIGTHGFINSTVHRLVGQYITGEALKSAFLMWDKPASLTARRGREFALYSS